MKCFLRNLAKYFSGNMLSVLNVVGVLFGCAPLFNYYRSIHCLPPLDGSLIYIVFISSITGVIFIAAMALILVSLGMLTRQILPSTIRSFDERARFIMRVFGFPQLIISLIILWLESYEIFDENAFDLVLLLPIFGAFIVFSILSRHGWQKNKLLDVIKIKRNFLNKYKYISIKLIMFCVIYFISVMFLLIPALLISPHMTRNGDGRVDEIFGSGLIILMVICVTTLIAAYVRDFSSVEKIIIPEEIKQEFFKKRNDVKNIAFMGIFGAVLFGLFLFLPTGFGKFLAKNIVDNFGIAMEDADILVNQEGCDIVNDVAPLYVKQTRPNACRIVGIKILSSLGGKFILSAENINTDLYVFPGKESVDFSKIKGNAVILVGQEEKRDAYLVRNDELMMDGRAPLVVSVRLSDEGERQLDLWQPGRVTVNFEQRKMINQVLHHIKSKANFWEDDEEPDNFDLPKDTVQSVVTKGSFEQ